MLNYIWLLLWSRFSPKIVVRLQHVWFIKITFPSLCPIVTLFIWAQQQQQQMKWAIMKTIKSIEFAILLQCVGRMNDWKNTFFDVAISCIQSINKNSLNLFMYAVCVYAFNISYAGVRMFKYNPYHAISYSPRRFPPPRPVADMVVSNA